MEYTKGIIKKGESRGIPVTANFAPPPAQESVRVQPRYDVTSRDSQAENTEDK